MIDGEETEAEDNSPAIPGRASTSTGQVENMTLMLPLTAGILACKRLGIENAVEKEANLRFSQLSIICSRSSRVLGKNLSSFRRKCNVSMVKQTNFTAGPVSIPSVGHYIIIVRHMNTASRD